MYGREGELYKLDRQRKDESLPRFQRWAADRAFTKIAAQLNDRKLMGLREQLIKATKASDELYMHRITQAIREYEGQDRESGIGYYE